MYADKQQLLREKDSSFYFLQLLLPLVLRGISLPILNKDQEGQKTMQFEPDAAKNTWKGKAAACTGGVALLIHLPVCDVVSADNNYYPHIDNKKTF